MNEIKNYKKRKEKKREWKYRVNEKITKQMNV